MMPAGERLPSAERLIPGASFAVQTLGVTLRVHDGRDASVLSDEIVIRQTAEFADSHLNNPEHCRMI